MARLPGGSGQRMDRVLRGGELRSELILDTLLAEIQRREEGGADDCLAPGFRDGEPARPVQGRHVTLFQRSSTVVTCIAWAFDDGPSGRPSCP